jgi:hypothetical protein
MTEPVRPVQGGSRANLADARVNAVARWQTQRISSSVPFRPPLPGTVVRLWA